MEKQVNIEKFDLVWKSIGKDSIEYLDKHFEDITSGLVHFLISSLLENDEIEIGIFTEENQKGAIVSYDIYNTDKQLNLKAITDLTFEIELFLSDNDDNEKIYKHILSQDQVKIIPEVLKNLMIESAVTEKDTSIRPGTLKD
jgi:hypothetical protein